MDKSQEQIEREFVIQITLNKREAELLETALDECYTLFGGNEREFDEMCTDVRRQLTSKNNIRETNIA